MATAWLYKGTVSINKQLESDFSCSNSTTLFLFSIAQLAFSYVSQLTILIQDHIHHLQSSTDTTNAATGQLDILVTLTMDLNSATLRKMDIKSSMDSYSSHLS